MNKKILPKASFPLFLIVIAFLYCLPALSGARGEVLATDSFEYETGSDLDGADGGGGNWTGSWQVPRGSMATRQNFTTQESQNGSTFVLAKDGGTGKRLWILRQFEDYAGEKIFVRFKIEAEELPAESDSFYFFFQNAEAFTTAYRLSMGVKEGMLMARYFPDRAGTRQGPAAEIGKTYVLVGEFSKSAAGDFDTVKFWVDPGPNDYFADTGEVALPSRAEPGYPGRHRTQSVNTLGFALEGVHPGIFRIRDLVIATDWSDVAGPHK
jgi:hypothetical protein